MDKPTGCFAPEGRPLGKETRAGNRGISHNTPLNHIPCTGASILATTDSWSRPPSTGIDNRPTRWTACQSNTPSDRLRNPSPSPWPPGDRPGKEDALAAETGTGPCRCPPVPRRSDVGRYPKVPPPPSNPGLAAFSISPCLQWPRYGRKSPSSAQYRPRIVDRRPPSRPRPNQQRRPAATPTRQPCTSRGPIEESPE